MSICFGVAKGPLATSSTFWCRCISLISPIPCNDPYDGSHYIRHSILYPNGTSAFRLADFPYCPVSFPTPAFDQCRSQYFDMTPAEFFAPLDDANTPYRDLCEKLRTMNEEDLEKVSTFIGWIEK